MFRPSKIRSLVVVGSLLLALGGSMRLSAQEETEEEYVEAPRRSRSLSQRLEQFRQDLLGGESDNQPEPASRMVRRSNSVNTMAGKAAPTLAKQRSTDSVPSTNRGVARQQPRPEGMRVAARPAAPVATVAEPAAESEPPPRKATPVRRTETPTEEPATEVRIESPPTRSSALQPTVARPARRGAFDSSIPRVARSQPVSEPKLEVPEEPAEIEPTPVRSTKTGVLFSAKSPVLSVEATGPSKVLVGREAAFTIHLRNVGEVVANNVVVKINIPPNTDVMSCEATHGTANPPQASDQAGTLEWKLERVELEEHQKLSLKIIPRKNSPLDLTMQWTSTPETSQAVVEVQEAKLAMSINGPSEVFYGQSKIYKVSVSNPGNGDAENVTLMLMPIGGRGEGPTHHRLGHLSAGDSKTVEIELTASQGGKLEIKAQAFAEGGLRTEVAQQVTVRRAQLKIAVVGPKVKYAGTPATFRVRIANGGDAIAEGVEVLAMLPPDAKYISSSNGGKLDRESAVGWVVGSVPPGEERTFEVQCNLTSAGENAIEAIVQGTGDLHASASTSTQVEALADLKLEVRDPQGPVPVGDDAVYEIVIRNRGTKAAEGIDLITFFSEGLEAIRVEGAEHQIGQGQVVAKTLPGIGPGAEMTIHFHCKADRPGNLVFRAEVTCRNPGTKLAAEETTHFYGDQPEADGAAAEQATTIEQLPQQ